MFSINWAKEEKCIKIYVCNDYILLIIKVILDFFLKIEKQKNPNFNLKIGFNKNIFNFYKSEFYKNKCFLRN